MNSFKISVHIGFCIIEFYKPSIGFCKFYHFKKNKFYLYFGVRRLLFIKQPYFKFVVFTIQLIQLTVLA